jgi:hypothetical protein
MVSVESYAQFGGIHWETGSLRNVLAHKGIHNPHTGQPFSEAMLFGLTGGVAVMYFMFEYEGQPPQLYIGTRYPFDPLDRVIDRLGLIAVVSETTSQKRAVDNLLSVLATGEPAIVWADMFQLRYNALPSGGFPGMHPVVVYGYNSDTGEIRIADRSSVPLTATTGEVSAARAAQGNLENRILIVDIPEKRIKNLGKAIRDAIKACILLYTDKPPKGPSSNFGFKALDKWADLIVNERKQKGWKKLFANRAQLYEALKSVYTQIENAGNGGGASRPTYATFLDEAAEVLGKPALVEVAEEFQMAGEKWTELAVAVLPEEVESLRETRDLILRRGQIFRAMGQAALPEMDQIAIRLNELRDEVGRSFPLSNGEVDDLLSNLQAGIHRIREVEEGAVKSLKKVVK